ncbi:MAG: RHS repeat-associated core domain-containing protein [Bacteriovoracaceae bacterium]
MSLLTYNLNGYLETFTTPTNETYEMTYTSAGLLTSFEKPEGEVSTFSYDSRGGLFKDEHSGGSSTTLTQTTDSSDYPLKRVTSTSEMGREVVRDIVNVYLSMDQGNATTVDKNGTFHVRYEDGARAEFYNTYSVSKSLKPDPRFGNGVQYDGRVNFSVDNKSHVTEVTKEVSYVNPSDPFDFSGLKQIVKTGNNESVSTFNNNTRTWTTVTAEGRESKYQLNALEDVSLTQLGSLAPINYSYNTKGLLSKIKSEDREFIVNYNNFGFISQIIDPLGSVINYDRDSSGRILREINPEGRETRYEWDLNGRMTKLITPNNSIHEFIYNEKELLGEYIPPQIPPYDTSTTYEYNLDKDLTKITLPDEREINFNYNMAGKLISKGNFDDGMYEYTYSVNDPSRISSVSKTDSIKLKRNYLGPLLKSEEQVVIANDNMIAKIDFNYDEMFRLSKITLEDSAGNFGYSPYFTYDKDNSLITAGDVQVKRNEIGQVSEKKLGKVQALYSYDEKFGELTRVEYRHNGKTISFQEFERDKLGRISTMFTETGKQVLHYDRSGRFTGRSLVGSTRPYSKFIYDKNGNRVSGHDDERTFKAEYDVHDRLTKYNNTNYYYELNGELAQTETDGELVEYFYDVFGNLTGVETPNKFIEYKVDGFNRRVSKTIRGSDVTRYIWQDQLRLAAELNGDGTLRSQFIYTDGVNSPEYMIKDGVRYFFVKDHRGSVLKVVDIGTGEVRQELKYSEFGEVLQDTNPGFQPFGFAGGLYDHDTKLVRFGARDYDGRIGRWLLKDPIRFAGGTPNLYEYAINDPVNFVDPEGKWPEWLDKGVCKITGKCDPTDADAPDWDDTLLDYIKDIFDDSKEPSACGQ